MFSLLLLYRICWTPYTEFRTLMRFTSPQPRDGIGHLYLRWSPRRRCTTSRTPSVQRNQPIALKYISLECSQSWSEVIKTKGSFGELRKTDASRLGTSETGFCQLIQFECSVYFKFHGIPLLYDVSNRSWTFQDGASSPNAPLAPEVYYCEFTTIYCVPYRPCSFLPLSLSPSIKFPNR